MAVLTACSWWSRNRGLSTLYSFSRSSCRLNHSKNTLKLLELPDNA